eukprot:GFUD01009582.1.p1 GENE.GFUD01009582.1~~GFUD01009582.1.p1  ORF type:complete len:767 (-),score=186.34 GFUD01009582.1:232-2472(-)
MDQRDQSVANSISLGHYNSLILNRINQDVDDFTGPDSLKDAVIGVVGVEAYAVHNAINHHTGKFALVSEHQVPVWRRGQTALITVTTSQPFNVKTHKMRVTFDFGVGSSVPQGTKIVMDLQENSHIDLSSTKQWGMQAQLSQGNITVLEILSSSTTAVGAYKITVETSIRSNPQAIKKFKVRDPVYILFNPWSTDDLVYMPKDQELEEYIDNDTGKVWVGTYRQIRSRPWVFGQFEDAILPAAFFVLDSSSLLPVDRGNPIKVSRAISAMVNDIDDRGVISGNWSGKYKNGTAPTDWTGSAAILEQYVANRGRPVKYGQCWVFSAVVTTICRAIGLPCRSVSNFVSGHDTNQSLTIDKFFAKTGKRLEGLRRPELGVNDSIWNFHVWNEVFMARPDLPKGYGGWQAIDSTPQEVSDRKFQCGPASVVAVKNGMIGLGYDVHFLFAEVNADLVHFVEDEESVWGFRRTSSNYYHVGRQIVTKSAGIEDHYGNSDLEDLTPFYKNTEGGATERSAVLHAVRGSERAREIYDYEDSSDVIFKLEDIDEIKFGEPYRAKIVLENTTDSKRTMSVLVSSYSIHYNGVKAKQIKEARGQFTLQPKEKDTLVLTVTPGEYMDKLVEYCMVKIYSMIRVVETDQTWTDEDDFMMDKPRLDMELVGEAKRKTLCQVKVSFTNPLPIALTECFFMLEAPGILREVKKAYRDVAPKEKVESVIGFYPRRAGSTKLVVRFNSMDMLDVNGTLAIRILA